MKSGAWPFHCWQGSCLGIWTDLFTDQKTPGGGQMNGLILCVPPFHSASAHMHWEKEEDDKTVALMKKKHGLLANFLSKSKFLRRNSLPQNCYSAVIHFCYHSGWLHNQTFGVDISIQPTITKHHMDFLSLCFPMFSGNIVQLSCFDGLRTESP